MRDHHFIICALALTIGLATFALPARADKLEGLDNTMQVLDDIGDLDKTAAYLRVPNDDDGKPDDGADEFAADDNASFDSDFEHDFDFEEDLMQDEDDFEDGDDVDDDLVSAPTATP